MKGNLMTRGHRRAWIGILSISLGLLALSCTGDGTGDSDGATRADGTYGTDRTNAGGSDGPTRTFDPDASTPPERPSLEIDAMDDIPPLERPSDLPIPGTDECRPPETRIWRLSPQQLRSAFANLAPNIDENLLETRLQLYSAAGDPWANDPDILNGAPLFTGELIRVIRDVALSTISEPDWLDACLDADEPGSGCIRNALRAYGRIALRRPATDEEVDRWISFYDEMRSEASHRSALEFALRRILAEPDALFRSEQGTLDEATGVSTLSPHEVADFIAFTITDAPPDAELAAAADDGSIGDPDVLEAHVQRLIEDVPDFQLTLVTNPSDEQLVYGILRFFREWLNVADVRARSHPELQRRVGIPDERVLRWLDNEVMMFVRHVLWEGDGTLKTLLNADFTIYSRTLSDYYSFEPRSPEGTFGATTGGRRGLLMQGGFLTAHWSTTMRGLFIRERLLCQHEPPAPPTADMNLPGLAQELAEEGQTLSPREVRALHMEDSACSGCHALLDPVGFPFDGFDELGLPRDEWDGFPIDTAGELSGTTSTNAVVDGPQELVELLANSEDVADCFVVNVFTWANGRSPTRADSCVMDELQTRFRDSGGDVLDLFAAVLTHRFIDQRTPLFDY